MNRIVAVLIAISVCILGAATVLAQGPGCKFVSDVTVPDDTSFQPGEVFTKTWKLQNTGGVDWLGYSLQFVSGDKMNGVPDAISPVKTNGLVDVTVVFTAPKDGGKYESWWRMVDDKGGAVGSQFYARIQVGATASVAKKPAAGPDTSKMIQMNQPFDVNGFTIVAKDIYRNKAVYEWGGTSVIAKGMYAIARLEVTSHVPYSVRFTDKVIPVFTDAPGNVYRASYEPLTVARSAQLAATRFFDTATTVWEDMQPTYVNFPIVHTEDVPESLDQLYLELIDASTERGNWVHLQPRTSKDAATYAGEFINAPERK